MTVNEEISQLLRLENGQPTDELDSIEKAIYLSLSGELEMHDALSALQAYAKLKAKDLDSRRCMYCGEHVPDTDEAMLEHIFSCEKRPEKTLLKKAFEIEDGLYAKIKHLMNHEFNPLYCEDGICQEIAKDMERYDSVPAEETDGNAD